MGSPTDIARTYDTTGMGGAGYPGDAVAKTGAASRYKNHQADQAAKNAATNAAAEAAKFAAKVATPNAATAIRFGTTGTSRTPVAAVEAAALLSADQANYTAAQEATALVQSQIDDPQNLNVIDVADTGTDPANAA